MTASTTGTPGVPPLSQRERVLLGTVGGLGVGVGVLGLAASFDAVSAAAARWGFGQPWMLPVGIDVAIPVFTAANLLLIRTNMPLAWVRWVPWTLTAVTCWLNVAAGHSPSAKVAHGTMPLLWVVLSEVAAHVYAVRIGAATGQRMDRIRRSRWLLAFPSTFALWRRMVLWEVTSYREALDLERDRQLARAELRERHGRRWRSRTPRPERVLLRLGEVAPRDDRADPVAPLPPQSPQPPEVEAPTDRPVREPKLRGPRKTPRRSPRLPFTELLDKARRATADWPYDRLEAAPIRKAVGCRQARSRQLREALKAERHDRTLTESAA
ncbi:DUF2637 domain-containing protein [Streptomyces phytohabitans]|uniref:DUF2637 domain-containing protein n=1 Tax=Streptomyces phytohabitans TaxID=1150371 RepID=UPI00345BD894